MTAVQKLDREGIPRQRVSYDASWTPHPEEPPTFTIGYCFHTRRKFSGAEIADIHPRRPIRPTGPTKYPRTRDPENRGISSLNLERVGVPLLPFYICASPFSSQLEEYLCLHDESEFA